MVQTADHEGEEPELYGRAPQAHRHYFRKVPVAIADLGGSMFEVMGCACGARLYGKQLS